MSAPSTGTDNICASLDTAANSDVGETVDNRRSACLGLTSTRE